MLWNFLRLAWLFGAISPSFSSPYGNIGCHFSEVCTEAEDCVEDNLFGSCVSSDSVSLPFYDVSRDGYRDLKIVIRFLLDRGYQWRDEAAQKTLETILGQYRMEYVDAELELEANYQREQELEALENMAAQYGSLFFNRKTNDRLEEEEEMSRNYGPAYYTEEEKRTYLPQNKAARGTSRDEVEDLIQEYVQAIKDSSPREKEEEVNWMYREYYQKYLDLLEQYRAMERAAENELAEGEEYGEESPDYYAEVQEKLDYLKQYLEEIYRGEVEEEEEEEEEEEAGMMEGSDEGMMDGGMSQSSSSWWDASSSSISEGGVEEVLAEGIDRLAVQLINNELIPQMTPQEQEQWKRLNEEEKEGIIQEALQAIDWVAMEMEAEDEKGGGVQREMVAEAMKEEEEEAEEEEAEVEEEAIEAAMKDGEWLNEGAESPLFEPEEENEGDKELQLDVLLPLEKKDDDDGVDEDSRGEELVDVGDKDMQAGESEEEEEDKKEESKRSEYSGFIFITFQEDITEEDADEIVALLVSLLELPPSIFSDIKVKDKEITVHVNDSSRHFTPKAIASKIAGKQRKLASMMGVHMVVTGVGHDPVKVVSAGSSDNAALVILTVVLVACVVGILIAIVTVYCLKKRSNEKAKVTELKQSEGENGNEASADYQPFFPTHLKDLCRQRMATKSDKPEPLTRVSSVAASDGAQPSPSSRSSTSSWSEEPVQSNMDISTGHVVLSYMEDHLNNKDRMSKEWEALCSYEADPCTQDAGKAPENANKNRVKTAVPYDHTRVKLTEETSANKSDYINSSAIMDIDPRAPAYIATQAPLANTLADFWQMIWEQGSVVIVNLTHMSETDINRCRYWPDEGSALYHFYEVHLVSEHVWCEDYLVRSFYLKNLETQETRTVTQFHFLTWPETGCPPSPKSLLEFRRKVNKSFRGRACPIVVHCSDGVGRTGTYCLLDLVLTRMLKGVKELDIAATLEHIRDQRPGMVQTQAQFEFALTAVVEEVNAILKALPQ